jgi:hypothetical protein
MRVCVAHDFMLRAWCLQVCSRTRSAWYFLVCSSCAPLTRLSLSHFFLFQMNHSCVGTACVVSWLSLSEHNVTRLYYSCWVPWHHTSSTQLFSTGVILCHTTMCYLSFPFEPNHDVNCLNSDRLVSYANQCSPSAWGFVLPMIIMLRLCVDKVRSKTRSTWYFLICCHVHHLHLISIISTFSLPDGSSALVLHVLFSSLSLQAN